LGVYGIILLNDVREIMFDNKLYETTLVKDLMVKSPDTIIIDEGMNGLPQRGHTVEGPSSNRPSGEDGEPGLYLVHPRRRRRCEMEHKSGPTRKP